jgi:hypothetical protein
MNISRAFVNAASAAMTRLAIQISRARPLSLAIAACLPAACFHVGTARADIVFDFTGECQAGCTGNATGVLTLTDDYMTGTEITAADFISMQYSSSHLSFDIGTADAPLIGGGLNSDGSFITLDGLTIEATEGEPIFVATPGEFGAALSHEQQDFGFSFTFTEVAPGAAVPESSTWTMMALGFVGLGFAGYRASRQVAT